MSTSDETKERVDLHHKVLFGDPSNIKESPGVIADQMRMGFEQARTNEILTELRNAVLWIVGLILTGVVTAVLALVYKTTGS